MYNPFHPKIIINFYLILLITPYFMSKKLFNYQKAFIEVPDTSPNKASMRKNRILIIDDDDSAPQISTPDSQSFEEFS